MKHLFAAATFAVAGAVALAPVVVSAQSSPSAHTSATRYDGLGRVVGTIEPDPDGAGPLKYAATRATYDVRGNVIKVDKGELANWKSESIAPANWGADFTVHSYVLTFYDNLNRKTFERVNGSDNVTASVTQYSYDNRGRLECTVVRMRLVVNSNLPVSACTPDPGSSEPDRITKTIYDAANQVIQIRKAVGSSVEIADSTYAYTQSGQIAQIIDANGNRVEQRFDGHDRQIRWVFPSTTRPAAFNNATPATALATAGSLNEGDYEAYAYDDNGNRLSLRKRDSSMISYQYDNLNRMSVKFVPARSGLGAIHTRDVYYSYDLQGRSLRSSFDSISGLGQTNVYDGFGRLQQTTDNSAATSRALSYQYDANGNRTRITHPDGAYFRYDYDGLDRLQSLRQSNTLALAFTYDVRGLPLRRHTSWNTISNNETNYGYDSAGRLDELDINVHGTSSDVSWDYTRNPASQIVSEAQSNDTYSWDGHVNLSRSYTTNGLNQYAGAGPANFTYDANGNLTSDGTLTYLYDVENRLVQVTGDGYIRNLYYDPLGRLYLTTSNEPGFGSIAYLYDGTALVAEYLSNGTMANRYVHGTNVEATNPSNANANADNPLIWFQGSSTAAANRRYLHSDPRGSIVAVTDYRGVSIRTNTYDEYGINGSSNLGRFQYTGQAWIAEVGLYYYKARFYSPTLGRFLQTDPVGYDDGYNIYAYVGNDPINFIDPTGLGRFESAEGENQEKIADAVNEVLETENGSVTVKVGGANVTLTRNGSSLTITVSANVLGVHTISSTVSGTLVDVKGKQEIRLANARVTRRRGFRLKGDPGTVRLFVSRGRVLFSPQGTIRGSAGPLGVVKKTWEGGRAYGIADD